MTDEIRQITDTDLTSVVMLLQEGFPNEDPEYWSKVVRRLESRQQPEGTEKYGYLLIVDDVPRGVILTISSIHFERGKPNVCINVSSWYVQASYRQGRSRALYARACGRADVTYINLSPVPHTIPTISRYGFQEWSAGQMAAVAVKAPWAPLRKARMLDLNQASAEGLADQDFRLLSDHQELGCLAVCLQTADSLHPLIFLKRRVKGMLPGAQLVLCREEALLTQFGQEITRGLWRRGYAFMLIDCSRAVPGLYGRYIPGKRVRYYRGEVPRSFIDYTYSEVVLIPGVT